MSELLEFTDLRARLNCDEVGRQMYDLAAGLFPICRSITGDGLRQTLKVIQRHIPIEIHEVPSGTIVFDWTVPNEWNIRDAWIADRSGSRIIDFRQNNLHVVNYSVPIRKRLGLEELKAHVHTMPDHPHWIPYRTSYYRENWGFCMAHAEAAQLADTEYDVCIDSTLQPGHLNYGEYFLAGDSTDEVLLSCHACHPSLANDNLSGIALMTLLAQHLQQIRRRYSYRFLFIPGTIGSITWLARNEALVDRIRAGLVVACVGDRGPFHYKKSRRGDAEIDRVATYCLTSGSKPSRILEFSPYGYDERQYCSPGFNLPVGSLTRTPHGKFPEYHSSADNLDYIQPLHLGSSFEMYLRVLGTLEANRCYVNRFPKAEPQLGKRGLYRQMGGLPDAGAREMAMLWLLNLSDGTHDLLEIAERSDVPFDTLESTAKLLVEHGLLA
ncbi:peptidase M28 [candidate division GN15 bacterium]|uniref:Peptidase M28 n=1 Tax=candidate division GN15 bacterium TaxID=2072418 RepID=A0A855X8N7_9BACT|nr:MAG: peptidase M28 [candidate division GN15 bacterium]